MNKSLNNSSYNYASIGSNSHFDNHSNISYSYKNNKSENKKLTIYNTLREAGRKVYDWARSTTRGFVKIKAYNENIVVYAAPMAISKGYEGGRFITGELAKTPYVFSRRYPYKPVKIIAERVRNVGRSFPVEYKGLMRTDLEALETT